MPASPLPVHELGVIHGRFQVLHNDHLKYLLAGKGRCRRLVVGLTNPDPVLTRDDPADPIRSLPESNPLTYYERLCLVRAALTRAGVEESGFSIVPFPISLPELWRYYLPLDAVFFLTIYDDWGRAKLARFKQMGLKTEVLWEKSPAEKGVSAAQVRRLMAEGGEWRKLTPPAAAELLERWKIPERLARGARHAS